MFIQDRSAVTTQRLIDRIRALCSLRAEVFHNSEEYQLFAVFPPAAEQAASCVNPAPSRWEHVSRNAFSKNCRNAWKNLSKTPYKNSPRLLQISRVLSNLKIQLASLHFPPLLSPHPTQTEQMWTELHTTLFTLTKKELRRKSARTPSETYLHWPPVLPARRDVSNNTCVSLFADINSIHFDYALARVETCRSCHCSYEENPQS